MASVYRETYEKETHIFENLISKYHPEYRKRRSKKYQKYVKNFSNKLASMNHLNIEFIVEQMIAHVGNLKHSNAPGEDYEDGSDSKVVSLYKVNKKDRPNPEWRVCVPNLECKNGLIRLVVYNRYIDSLDYFVFDVSEVKLDKQSRFFCNYNVKTNVYSKIEQFRVKSFPELCRAR